MKNLKAHLLAALAALALNACSQPATTDNKQDRVEGAAPLTKAEIGKAYFVSGDTIAPEGAVAVDAVVAALDAAQPADFTVKSTISAVCVKKGCWMKTELANGKAMQITFKDYAFFVPKDLAGKEVVFAGHGSIDTLGVEERRHYAEDAGKSKEEIAAITTPEITYTFEATGVLIPRKEEADAHQTQPAEKAL